MGDCAEEPLSAVGFDPQAASPGGGGGGVAELIPTALAFNRDKYSSATFEELLLGALEHLLLQEETRTLLQGQQRLLETLESTTANALSATAGKIAKGALFALRGAEERQEVADTEEAAEGVPHVMLSYQVPQIRLQSPMRLSAPTSLRLVCVCVGTTKCVCARSGMCRMQW